MLLTPRLLSLIFAVVFVFASPYVVGAQSKPPAPAPPASAPKTGVPAAPAGPAPQGTAPRPGVPAAPAGPAPQGTAPKPGVPAAQGPPTQVAGQPAPKPAGPPAPSTAAPAAAPAAAAPAPVTPVPAVPAGPQLEPQGYTYDAAGRRDPFVSLVRRGNDTTKSTNNGPRGAGLAGLETGEVTLKGTIASEGGYVGIVQGSDNKTYIVRAGDKLLDGTIRAITQDSMVVTQQVTDPLSLEKQREVRKVLRQTEEAK